MYSASPHSAAIAEPIATLIEELGKLPGIGPKTAQRLAYFIVREPAEEARRLASAIVEVKDRVIFCSVCWNISESDPCAICSSPSRDHSRICVVEQPLDILALERTHSYTGLYHVLHGALSPIDGIGPAELKIESLVQRAQAGGVQEVILATNPTMQGDATATYLARMLAGVPILLTRPARGLPMGGDLEFADELTLRQALDNRRDYR
jgi:recombination protein RecR